MRSDSSMEFVPLDTASHDASILGSHPEEENQLIGDEPRNDSVLVVRDDLLKATKLGNEDGSGRLHGIDVCLKALIGQDGAGKDHLPLLCGLLVELLPEVQNVIDFVENSERGLIR